MKANELTKQMLESITEKDILNHRRVKAILANFDIHSNNAGWLELMRKGIAAKEIGGLTWKQVDAYLDDIKSIYA